MKTNAAPPITPSPVCIDEQELSRLTTLSRTTLQTTRAKGIGPPYAKLGHRVVYRLADVECWIAEWTRSPGA
jgi:predicted DNA-binding transcriptional regulator AlpA